MTSAEASLVSRTFKTRLRSDPSLGISDLMKPFTRMLEHFNSRDIFKVLSAPPEMDWKSSPQVKWLCRQQVLFKGLLEIAPNTVITSRKVKEALQRIQDEEPVNLTKRDDATLWDYVDTKVRIGLAQLRELKNNRDYCLDRAMRKLADGEKDVLRIMLDMIHFNEVNSKAEDNTTTTKGEDEKKAQQEESSLALVPVLPSKGGSGNGRHHHEQQKTLSSQQASSASATHHQAFAFQAVFNNILQKNASANSPDAGGKQQKQKQLEEGFMASQSSEATTPDKNHHQTKRKLSFSAAAADDDDDEQHGSKTKKTRQEETTITILPAGHRILEEKKRRSSTSSCRSTKKEEYCEAQQASNQKGLFDDLLDAVGDEESASENEKSSQLPASSKVNKGKNAVSSSETKMKGKKKSKKDDEEEQDPAGILDSVSRLLLLYFDECQFLFAFLESVMFRWCLGS